MPTFTMQKQASRNLVISPKVQTTWGTRLLDASLTYRQRFNPSTVFEKMQTSRSDQMTAGKGSEWATDRTITSWDTKGTLTAEADAFLLSWMCALIFGQETDTGAGPYTHAFTVPLVTATMPCTTLYIEETNDQHFYLPDMAATSLSLTVPERGAITAALDMVGTGKWTAATFGGALPALVANNYLLGNDMQISITPSGGALTSFVGRQKSLSIKVDRQAKPFQSSGDGLYSNSVASGQGKFSVDFTIAANAADDVNGWFEAGTALAISIATNPAKTYQCGFTFPIAYAKANKLGNVEDKVMWSLSFDETSCLQNGAQAAISAFVIDNTPAFLIAG
jgi:Phage tail tube protein